MRYALLLLLATCAAAQNVTVMVWNGVPDQKAQFSGYLALEGGKPIQRGATLWIPVGKGEFIWEMPPVNPLDKFETLYGDFNLGSIQTPHWKTSIHCELSVPNQPHTFGVMFVENSPGKYGCVIQ